MDWFLRRLPRLARKQFLWIKDEVVVHYTTKSCLEGDPLSHLYLKTEKQGRNVKFMIRKIGRNLDAIKNTNTDIMNIKNAIQKSFHLHYVYMCNTKSLPFGQMTNFLRNCVLSIYIMSYLNCIGPPDIN